MYCLIIAAIFSVITYLYSYYAAKNNFLNNAISYSALSFVFTVLFLILFVIRKEYFYINFINFFLIVFFTLFIIVLITSSILFTINIIRRDFDIISINFKKPNRIKLDLYRKSFHILVFFSLLLVFYISTNFQTIYRLFPSDNLILIFTKRISGFKNNFYLIEEPGFYYYVILYFFLILTFVILTNEFTRKTKYFYFPLNFIPNFLFHKDENNKYGSYVYFSIGHLFAAFITPPNVLFAILSISVFGDTISSQFGMRFGNIKYKWNEKTFLGTISGFIVSLFITSLFVDVFYAILFSSIFVLTDLITQKPIRISDNLAVPIVCSILYNIITICEVLL